MEHGVRIASFWRLRINLSIYESLSADSGYAASDCIMGIPSSSGFDITAFHKDRTDCRYQGFVPESVMLSLRGLLPNLHLRILESQENRITPPQDARDEALFQTPMHFYMTEGMSVANLLANQFSETEMTDLHAIMNRNQDRYPANRILCEGLERAIKLIQAGDQNEILRIVKTHASPMLHLHDGLWYDIEVINQDSLDKDSLMKKGKLDIFVNYSANYPFLLRITERFCKQTSVSSIAYPYSGRQMRTIYVCMTADDFLGSFLYPMEMSSEMYRRQHYIDNYGIAPNT